MSRESHNAKERAKRIGAKMGCGSFAAPPGSGPWIMKQRPAGDWVVDQLCGAKLRVRRYGPYETHAAAKAKWLDLTAPNDGSQRRRTLGNDCNQDANRRSLE